MELINEEQLEKLRRKARRLENAVCVISVLSFPLYLYLFYIAMREEEEMSLMFAVKMIAVAAVVSIGTLTLLWIIIVKHTYDKFNRNFKARYVMQTISRMKGFENLEYFQKKGFSWDDIRNAAVVDCGHKKYFKSEDLLEGTCDGTRFKISDVTTQKVVRRNKKTRTEEIFSGQVICLYQFDEMKKSSGHLQIFEKSFLSDMSGWKAEHAVQTENEAFNSRFKIYASDEHNAYYILTPQRMEKIMNFADVTGGQVSLVFQDDRLFAAVKRSSMFDAVMNKPVSEQTEKIKEDAEFIQKAKEILVMS